MSPDEIAVSVEEVIAPESSEANDAANEFLIGLGLRPDVGCGLWVATARWHGLKWMAVGPTSVDAVDGARAAAATGVWKGHPMTEAPQYVDAP